MTKLFCGYCNKDFEADTKEDRHGFKEVRCPHCGRTFPGSKIESTGDLAGKKHIHIPYKSGDVVGKRKS